VRAARTAPRRLGRNSCERLRASLPPWDATWGQRPYRTTRRRLGLRPLVNACPAEIFLEATALVSALGADLGWEDPSPATSGGRPSLRRENRGGVRRTPRAPVVGTAASSACS